MKSFRVFLAMTLGGCYAAVPLSAGEVVTCKSPDGKFALRCVYANAQPYNGKAAIVEMPAHKAVFVLDPNWTLGHVKLVWSPDSQRVAYFSEKGNNYATRLFFRNGSSFSEIALPDFPSPKLPSNATAASDADTTTRIEAMSWSGSGDLLLEKELLNPAWGRAALRITLGFDLENQPSLRSVEQEKVSIIDYFLLLPPENFEAPPSAWLSQMRGHNHFFPCDSKPEHNIDEKNGYLSCSGDGAQSNFDVALFRHRDGRPLLAFCSAQVEPDDSFGDSVYLKFFELGPDGKMQEIKHSMFPGAGNNYDSELGEGKGSWEFVLPRQGRTILVRSLKSQKVLHKFAWDGEKFVEQK